MQKSQTPGSILNMKWSGLWIWRGEIAVFMKTPNIRWAALLTLPHLVCNQCQIYQCYVISVSLFLECSSLLYLYRICIHVSQPNSNAGPSTKPFLSDTSFPYARKSKSFPTGGFYHPLLVAWGFNLSCLISMPMSTPGGTLLGEGGCVCQGQGHKHVTLSNPEIKWALCRSLWN